LKQLHESPASFTAFRQTTMIYLSKVCGVLSALACLASADTPDRSPTFGHGSNRTEGLAWPKGQAIPTFATPAAVLDTLMVQDLSKDEQITFSALQGRVNRKQPRIFLANRRSEEGPFTWLETAKLERKMFAPATKFEFLAKYAPQLDGVVLYNPDLSPHYRNLAGTLAPQLNAIPVTPALHEEIKKAGTDLKVLADLTTFKLTTPLEIYGHLLEHYWPKAEKRILVSSKPHDERGGGDYHHTRDIAAATGAAVVWLDTRIPEERDLLRKFFSGMKAGEAIALGWYATERTGITTASEFGIGTMPADHFMNASVFAGTDHLIKIPPVPRKPPLENKVYVAVFISDGDNIQYTQHAMRRNWDRIADSRGKVPLNWTIAPGLVDVAPAILNYYYGTATPNDCFVTGPSGMGYLMPTNTLSEPGAPVGESLKDPAMMDGYTRMTEVYLQRSGLRVATIWDDASPALRAAYERNCRHLYGATVQNFKDMPSVASSVENERLPFDKLEIPYAGSYEHISGSLSRSVRRWDGAAPLFLSYQVDVWGQMRANRIIELQEQMNRDFPGKVEFVRADHYFNLYNEARGLPFNLSMAPGTKGPEALLDGTPTTLWSAPGKQSLDFDLGSSHRISRIVIRHAGEQVLNTRDFSLQTSEDGTAWTLLQAIRGNQANITDLDFKDVPAKHVKLVIENPGNDATARIAEVEIFGRRPD
jgi:hypothetical protein